MLRIASAGMTIRSFVIAGAPKASLRESEAISTVCRMEIATATCCGLAITTGKIPGFKSERLRRKNRLPENLPTPKIPLIDFTLAKLAWSHYII